MRRITKEQIRHLTNSVTLSGCERSSPKRTKGCLDAVALVSTPSHCDAPGIAVLESGLLSVMGTAVSTKLHLQCTAPTSTQLDCVGQGSRTQVDYESLINVVDPRFIPETKVRGYFACV